jgi:SpoVK/Ycf46/Vps4 family AAA+-type ATPase
MGNRRRTHSVDPKRINNYNKFLCALDKTANTTKTPKEPPPPDNAIKDEIDDIISTAQTSFNASHDSSSFTGQLTTDSSSIDSNDPNYYSNNVNPGYLFFYAPFIPPPHLPGPPSLASPRAAARIPTIVPSKKEPPIQPEKILETINIEAEITNISDILRLIDTYKLDPAIKYNINMQALHNIKDQLIEMNNMIGMQGIKCNVVDQILYFVQELHKGKRTTGDFMHTVIYGPPGTGKTEVAKIIGKIYSNIGVLSKATFKKVTRSDLIAGYLGQTAVKTRDVIKEALGGVLFIDEAYALGNPEKRDSFSKECIDTLCEALSDHKDNLMVIIAGYEKELKESFFSANPGLDSRFTWRFKIDEYTADDLYNIFLKKVSDIDWQIDANSKITVDWFKKHKECFTFFGRDIETVLAKTKIAHSRRVFCRPESEKRQLVLKDLDSGFEMYMQNEEVKGRKDDREMKHYLYSTLYS